MIQLIVNTNLLREFKEVTLLRTYGIHKYNDESDVTEDAKIKSNLESLLNWDINGDNGLKIYCGKFESIKEKDWQFLINLIKEHKSEIKQYSYVSVKKRRLENIKIVNDFLEQKEQHRVERFTDENYTVSGRGKKAKPCIYEGREYKSRQECMYKEELTRNKLYQYLKNTGQL